MLYVQEVVTGDEKIMYGARYHWMFLMRGFISLFFWWAAAFSVLWLGVAYYAYPDMPFFYIHKAFMALSLDDFVHSFWHLKPLWRMFAFILIMWGVLHLGLVFLVRATTEIAVTDKRLIYKQGWIARRVQEMAMMNIESVSVTQTFLGRFLGYGSVDCFGTGDGDIDLPDMIDNPVTLRRMIQSAQTSAHEHRAGA